MRFGAAALPVVVLLSLLAFVASIAVAERAEMEGRAERLLAAFTIWLGIVELPTYGLAWANVLYPGLLAGVSAAVSAAALVLSGVGRRPGEHVRIVLAALHSMLKLPGDGLVAMARQRSFAFVGLLASLGMIAWSALAAYLAPQAGWDGLWYHDTIVGYAVQNHGFSIVDIPETLFAVNNFPRTAETLALWFVAFGDRALIELPNSVMLVPLMAGVYVMARRYTPDKAFAVGCASAIALMPGTYLELRSTYIDVTVAAFFVGALHFATRPRLRLRDAWMAALLLGLLLGSKTLALSWTPIIGVVLLVRVLAANAPTRPAATAATILLGTMLLLAVGAPNYIRNWIVYKSPIWPWGLDVKLLHIHWPGNVQVLGAPAREPPSFFGTMLSPPVPGRDWPDQKEHGYGLGLPLLVLPLGVLGFSKALADFVVGVLRRGAIDARTTNVLYVAAPTLATMWLAPDLLMARYNIHVPVALLLLTAYLLVTGAWVRVREGVTATVIVTSLLLFYWAGPGWGMGWSTVKALWHLSPHERAGMHVMEYLPEAKVVAARETELGRGDVVAWSEGILFPGELWNERYANKVVWIPSSLGTEKMLARADEIGAKWYVVSGYSAENSVLKSRPGWQEIGQLSTTAPAMMAYRRVPK
jgi:hypothetical protein